MNYEIDSSYILKIYQNYKNIILFLKIYESSCISHVFFVFLFGALKYPCVQDRAGQTGVCGGQPSYSSHASIQVKKKRTFYFLFQYYYCKLKNIVFTKTELAMNKELKLENMIRCC